jgi:hypothetical protein
MDLTERVFNARRVEGATASAMALRSVAMENRPRKDRWIALPVEQVPRGDHQQDGDDEQQRHGISRVVGRPKARLESLSILRLDACC